MTVGTVCCHLMGQVSTAFIYALTPSRAGSEEDLLNEVDTAGLVKIPPLPPLPVPAESLDHERE